MRSFYTAPLALMLSCATTSSSGSGSTQSEAEAQKLAITNVIPFDLAACAPRALSLSPLTTEVLTGAVLSRTPAFEECFVNPKTREGTGGALRARLSTSSEGVQTSVEGEGASTLGKTCIETALKQLPVSNSKSPLTTEVPISAGQYVVHMGDNAANDIAGTLRLAQPSWCECYATVMAGAPPALKANVKVAEDGTVTANFDDKTPVTECLSGKIQALNLGKTPIQLTWPLLLKNSYSTVVDATAPAPLRFSHYEGMRAQATADVLIAAGQRTHAALSYDELAAQYKKKPSKPALEQLKQQCNQVVSQDDTQRAALQRLFDVLNQALQLATTEKAQDAQWAQVEAGLTKQLTTTQGELARVEKQKQNDLAACPKMKF